MNKPNFLIVGVQKAGTTSIYQYLKQHPQVFMSPIKETNFLEQDWENLPPERQNKNGIVTWEKYCQLFDHVQSEIAIGEASPNYLLYYESSARRIQRYVPQARLIAVLRNPVERAYSDYLMHVRDAIGGGRSLSQQIQLSGAKSHVLAKGLYYQPLKHYFDTFDREQIGVYLYDDLARQPVEFMQRLYDFVGVDSSFVPDTGRKAQTAQVPKNQTINRLLRQENPLRTLARKTLQQFLPLQARQQLRDRLIQLNSAQKTALSPQELQQLQDFYREDIIKLQDLIDRDLSGWLKGR